MKKWGENNRPIVKWDEDGLACQSCMGFGDCYGWVIECGYSDKRCSVADAYFIGHCYCNKTQTEALLKWHDEKYGTIQERVAKKKTVGDLDFRVGDKVTVVGNSRLFESNVENIMMNGGLPYGFMVMDEDRRKHMYFSMSRKNIGGYEIYHGHNLKITVEEKSPVRMVEKWLTVFYDNNAGETVSIINESDKEPLLSPPRFTLIYGPIEVQIPK